MREGEDGRRILNKSLGAEGAQTETRRGDYYIIINNKINDNKINDDANKNNSRRPRTIMREI
jgi:hypothetical protein